MGQKTRWTGEFGKEDSWSKQARSTYVQLSRNRANLSVGPDANLCGAEFGACDDVLDGISNVVVQT